MQFVDFAPVKLVFGPGRLEALRDTIVLKDGRTASLEVWVEPQDIDKTQHTMDSLKKSIRWDEERWGLELDLDGFRIVATNDFNFGAMENKGLNIFNARYALANPKVATDQDYANIESVVGHEYFHNWTGDRVTLRDWFQLTLKEGLTVFRDQEFSADMLGDESARAVERIRNVKALRLAQFAEDAGPVPTAIRRSTTSTRAPCMKRAPKSSACSRRFWARTPSARVSTSTSPATTATP